MSTYTITHPRFGQVTVTERRGSTKFSARWKEGRLFINIPAHCGSLREISARIDSVADEIERIRPRSFYRDGTLISIDSASPVSIRIATGPVTTLTPTVNTNDGHTDFTIIAPLSTDFSDPDIQRRINTAVHLIGRRLAASILLPRATALAAALGLRVDKWEIAHGRNVLGTCYPTQRRIRLSYLNVFLTPELRDYIICHELAHLTESGHTDRFHTLCDRYCNGREAALIRLLRSYPWPIMR
ncbi:MAG: M48 family metallopeptidase [Staphylococcus sp.]|nr:M48 family metallopeptidase [Staphylococcus sp.]